MDFKAVELLPGIWQLSDAYDNCSTLILGENKALLFDTMIGIGDLKGFVRTLTELPVVVVNSHGHTDHVGNNCLFDEVYINRKEYICFPDDEAHISRYQEYFDDPVKNTILSLQRKDNLRDLEEDMTFDLGGITAQAISLPGHTEGGMGLLIPERRVLLVGDAISPQMCLFLFAAQTMDIYLETLDKAEALDIDYLIGGHFMRLFPKRVISTFRECALRSQNKKGFAYSHSILNDYSGRVHVYDPFNEDAGCPVMIIVK